jgi:hypothetical protein
MYVSLAIAGGWLGVLLAVFCTLAILLISMMGSKRSHQD